MDESENYDIQHTTEWALLFPLRTGLLSLKSSFASLSETENHDGLGVPYKAEYLSEQNISYFKMSSENSSAHSSVENLHQSPRLRSRRRSSMSDLDKLGGIKSNVPDIVRSVTSHSYEHEYDSAPNSPNIRYIRHLHKSEGVRGSIGDFMNFKRFGGGSGYRTETIIAKTVPLSTVTKRSSSRDIDVIENQLYDDEDSYRSSRNSFRGSRSSFNDSKSSLDSVDAKSPRVRKYGLVLSENLLMQHCAKNVPYLGSPQRQSYVDDLAECNVKVPNLHHSNSFRRGCSSVSSCGSATTAVSQDGFGEMIGMPLSGSQRTERLSRIIRQQRSTHQLYANISVSWLIIR